MKLELIETTPFKKEDGTFDLVEALNWAGKFAGECYSQYGLEKIKNEDNAKTLNRINVIINSGHHSPFDHINVSLEMTGIPKILAMVLNNEKQYTTSEKSLRYTKVDNKDGIISAREEALYNEWIEIYQKEITKVYGSFYDEKKIKKLAQENARYLVTVFIPTCMVYTTSIRQYNYLASFMEKYIEETKNNCILYPKQNYDFERLLSYYMSEFIKKLDELHILDRRLMNNEKSRSLSLFAKNININNDMFDELYLTTYKTSFACLAQAQRHRSLNYEMARTSNKEYFVPPIIRDNSELTTKWLYDMDSVRDVVPQGELLLVKESGSYDNFILKCKERLCSNAQLEIMLNTRATLLKYRDALNAKYHYLAEDIEKYTKGARCTFCDFKCTSDCHFKEGKTLTRKI